MIPKNCFNSDAFQNKASGTQFKSMKTQDLEEARFEEKVRLDDSIQFRKSREDLV